MKEGRDSPTVGARQTPSRIKIVVQHHPSREALLSRFKGLNAAVQPDPQPDGPPSAWRCYAACLGHAPERGHLLILQDDALVPDDLLATLESLIEEKPDGLIALFVPALSGKHNLRMRNAALQGFPWCQLDPNEWCPVVATCWPVEEARRCAAWAGGKYGERVRADDAVVGAFAREHRVPVWATVPSVVDHDESVDSLMGGHRKSNPARRAVLAPAWRSELPRSVLAVED